MGKHKEFCENCRNSRKEPECQVREPVTYDGRFPKGDIMCVHLMCKIGLNVGNKALETSNYQVRSVVGGDPEPLVIVATPDKPTASEQEFKDTFKNEPEMVENFVIARRKLIQLSAEPELSNSFRRYIGMDTGRGYSLKKNGDIAPNGQRLWLKK